ncbi:MAG: DUF2959 domain-containing protein [Opitutaceae bacterium]|nr:DUF2959 domain-containing protein [Opitutaceae bacterium]
MKRTFRSLPIALVLLLAGCSSAYYGAMEKMGVAKRDILADRVDKTREAQADAKRQFASALQHFQAVTKTEGGDLQKKYEELNREFERSESRAKEVRSRISAVEDVAEAMFREWRNELAQYTNPKLKGDSQRQHDATRGRYDTLLSHMRRSAERMDPVLATFRDQVLYLKHNLNARALAQLDSTNRALEGDISRLIEDMETAIKEAEKFVKELKTTG